jgi:hypothetical protein
MLPSRRRPAGFDISEELVSARWFVEPQDASAEPPTRPSAQLAGRRTGLLVASVTAATARPVRHVAAVAVAIALGVAALLATAPPPSDPVRADEHSAAPTVQAGRPVRRQPVTSGESPRRRRADRGLPRRRSRGRAARRSAMPGRSSTARAAATGGATGADPAQDLDSVESTIPRRGISSGTGGAGPGEFF